MTDRQKEVLEHLFDLADGYYDEKTEDGSYIVSENQGARDFIQEVFVLTGELLDKFDKPNEVVVKEEIKKLVDKVKKVSPKSFVNEHNELIIEPKNNIYFRLEDVENELDFKCKVLSWLSRPSCKGLSNTWQTKIRKIVNEVLGTDFNRVEMEEIYMYLGNGINRKLCEKFVESDYDLLLLKK